MSVNPRQKTEAWITSRKSQEGISPEKTKACVEPKKPNYKLHRLPAADRKVSVVYYLSHNGFLEQPHFIEVSLSSPEGLYLRDVINRMNQLRGSGIANMYAWSSKRTYRSGYVWQDLSENDFIHPSHGKEYILKGTRLLLESFLAFRSPETASSETNSSGVGGDLGHHLQLYDVPRRSKSQYSFTALDDFNPITRTFTYRAMKAGLDASTQTMEEKGRRWARGVRHSNEEAEEIGKEGISPPPCSNSSSRESGMEAKSLAAGVLARGTKAASYGPADIRNLQVEAVGQRTSGRVRASAVLMQMIMCGSKNGDDVVWSHK
ncbi:hypothetical protein SAY86_013884 [Trapa natans]|uniref:SOSEKI DIX-like domain-containing protein n=1 Tax=Trapa natans TaxID=22666 RepID=A0AAN7KVC9_TRANT|nr:hypothetical protein SAY86_013884 [Trapa natans]